VRVVGDCPALGSWEVEAAPSLLRCRDGIFRRLRKLPRSRTATFKCVKLTKDGECIWEEGQNRVVPAEELETDRVVISAAFGAALSVAEASDEKLKVLSCCAANCIQAARS
jgi:hypothetical protein